MLFAAILISTANLVVAQQAVLSFNCQNAPNVCNNMCYHYRCIDTTHNVLTYDANTAARTGRRRDSGCQTGSRAPCRSSSWSASGNSCDEMPFASTHEGGTGGTLRCVPGPENSSQGGQLSGFYRNLNDGDRFRIAISNEQNSVLCTQTGCQNDGHEFKLTPNGRNGYVLARDAEARKNGAFGEAVVEKKGPAQKMRKFKDDHGEVHSLLVGDGNLVGQSLWTENGMRKIVSEVGGHGRKNGNNNKNNEGGKSLSDTKGKSHQSKSAGNDKNNDDQNDDGGHKDE